ncbi:MAG: hypothetical protein AAF961_10210, partial [Planctomycetota bacterium]
GMAHCMASLGFSATYVASILRTATRLDPENPSYRISLALQLVRCREPREAYEELRRVPVERFERIECECASRRLLHICLCANDRQRADVLGKVVQRLAGAQQK